MHSDDAISLDTVTLGLQRILQLLNWLRTTGATYGPSAMTTKPLPKDTPLAEWLRMATATQRQRCAALAGTSASYLYSLAGGHRQQISARLAFQLEDATKRLARDTRGRLPVVTARELAFMHDLEQL